MTNFDLSTYIRWLKPEAARDINQIAVLESEPRTMPSHNNYVPIGHLDHRSKFLNNSNSPFVASDDYLNKYSQPQRQEVAFQSEAPLVSTKSSSPTALSLLLRSSIFRELVEKNSNVSEDGTDGEEPVKEPMLAGCEDDDQYGECFFDGISELPSVCSSNSDSIELQEEKDLHFVL